MCAAIMDNWFGIDRPTATTTAPPPPLPAQVANPTAAETQSDLTPPGDSMNLKAKRRGTAALRIDRTSSAGNSGLNIPQA